MGLHSDIDEVSVPKGQALTPQPQNPPPNGWGSMSTPTRASWIFGSLFVVFLLGVFMFGPAELPDYKQRILAYVCALLAGLFALFFTGSLLLHAELPIAGKWAVQGGAGFALFLIVLFWWFGPSAPVKSAPVSFGGTDGRKPEEQNTSQPDANRNLSVGPVPVTLRCVRLERSRLVPFSQTILTVKSADSQTIAQEVQPFNGSILVHLIPGRYLLFWSGSGASALPFEVSAPETTITVQVSANGDPKSLSVVPQSKRPANNELEVAGAPNSKSPNQVQTSSGHQGAVAGQSTTQSSPGAQPSIASAQSSVPSPDSVASNTRPSAPASQPNIVSIPQSGNLSQPSVPAAVAGTIAIRPPARLSVGPPNPCPGLTQFTLKSGEFYDITIDGLSYPLYLKQVDNHFSRKDTAKIYVIRSDKVQWDTKQVPHKEFLGTINSLQQTSSSEIGEDKFAVFDLDDTSKKQIETSSEDSFWIAVKPHYVTSRAEFQVCPDSGH